jgi:hypothetical protein
LHFHQAILKELGIRNAELEALVWPGCNPQLGQQSLRPHNEERQSSENSARSLPPTGYTMFINRLLDMFEDCSRKFASQTYAVE